MSADDRPVTAAPDLPGLGEPVLWAVVDEQARIIGYPWRTQRQALITATETGLTVDRLYPEPAVLAAVKLAEERIVKWLRNGDDHGPSGRLTIAAAIERGEHRLDLS